MKMFFALLLWVALATAVAAQPVIPIQVDLQAPQREFRTQWAGGSAPTLAVDIQNGGLPYPEISGWTGFVFVAITPTAGVYVADAGSASNTVFFPFAPVQCATTGTFPAYVILSNGTNLYQFGAGRLTFTDSPALLGAGPINPLIPFNWDLYTFTGTPPDLIITPYRSQMDYFFGNGELWDPLNVMAPLNVNGSEAGEIQMLGAAPMRFKDPDDSDIERLSLNYAGFSDADNTNFIDFTMLLPPPFPGPPPTRFVRINRGMYFAAPALFDGAAGSGITLLDAPLIVSDSNGFMSVEVVYGQVRENGYALIDFLTSRLGIAMDGRNWGVDTVATGGTDIVSYDVARTLATEVAAEGGEYYSERQAVFVWSNMFPGVSMRSSKPIYDPIPVVQLVIDDQTNTILNYNGIWYVDGTGYEGPRELMLIQRTNDIARSGQIAFSDGQFYRCRTNGVWELW